jgi:hypothetical protein
MGYFLRQLYDWSEVWALLIPLAVMLRYKKRTACLKPIRIYIWIALTINIIATVIWKRKKLGLPEFPEWLTSNNYLYNIHSITRLLLFSWFFILLKQRFMHRIKVILPLIFIIFAIINFGFYENFFTHDMPSSRLLATEAGILLFYCLQYYIFLLLEDRTTSLKKQPGFWIVTGLSFYVAASFFIFLFYAYLIMQDLDFAVGLWDVVNTAYIFLCICIAITFYKQNDE